MFVHSTKYCLFSVFAILWSSMSVDGFVIPSQQQFSTQPFSRGTARPVPVNAKPAIAFRNPKPTNGKKHEMSLPAIPPAVWWILSHTTLPFTGVPFVINGTRKGGWYRKIDLPPWTPPDALFGPVWTFLYTCMGLAVSRIAKSSATPWRQNPLVVAWLGHFVLNMSWAPIFFGLQRFRMGLWISNVLIASLAWIVTKFYAVDPKAAFLLIPYALWLSFATFGLNVAICKRNPTKNGYNEGMFQAQLIQLQEEAAARVGL